MGHMPKKNSLTARRALALLLAYLTLCICGGVVVSLMVMPAVFGANNMAKALSPSLTVEGIEFGVTSLPQTSTLYAKPRSRADQEHFRLHAARGGRA